MNNHALFSASKTSHSVLSLLLSFLLLLLMLLLLLFIAALPSQAADPMRPPGWGEVSVKKKAPKKTNLILQQTIVHKKTGKRKAYRAAVINQRLLVPGDRIEGAKLLHVDHQQALLERAGQRFSLSIYAPRPQLAQPEPNNTGANSQPVSESADNRQNNPAASALLQQVLQQLQAGSAVPASLSGLVK